MRAALFAVLTVTAIVSGCAVSSGNGELADDSNDALSSDGADVDGIPSAFDHDRVMDDSFYEAKDWATADEVQAFLDNTVWDKPSWLAKETIVLLNDDTKTPIPISEAIARTAQAHNINPILLLARMQVEKGLVSPSSAPSASGQSFGLGCHKVTAAHPNGLDPSAAGLDYQLECGATTLETQIANARAAKNNWPIGKKATTQDGVSIDPSDAATSALYAYTPIEGTKAHNGNWLVWNITHRFAAAIQSAR